MADENQNDPETTELDTSKVVSAAKTEDLPPADPKKLEQESSPIFDEVDEELEVPEIASSYKADVKRALARETQDGIGDEDPGPSDFESFATEGVEKEAPE